MKGHNKALHLTAIPLRSIAAGELGRSPGEEDDDVIPSLWVRSRIHEGTRREVSQ